MWNWVSRVSIWNDLEEMITHLPWYFGIVFWWAPVVFFALLGVMGLYAVAFAGFWFTGLLAIITGKFLGAGWIRYGQKVMHPVLLGTPWYDKQFDAWSASKKAGLKMFAATGLFKFTGKVYNLIYVAFVQKLSLVQAHIKQFQDDRK